MPLFEYRCTSCGEEFEELVRTADELVPCPACGHDDAGRKLPLVRRTGSGGSDAAGAPAAGHGSGCAGCAGGSCGSCGH